METIAEPRIQLAFRLAAAGPELAVDESRHEHQLKRKPTSRLLMPHGSRQAAADFAITTTPSTSYYR